MGTFASTTTSHVQSEHNYPEALTPQKSELSEHLNQSSLCLMKCHFFETCDQVLDEQLSVIVSSLNIFITFSNVYHRGMHATGSYTINTQSHQLPVLEYIDFIPCFRKLSVGLV